MNKTKIEYIDITQVIDNTVENCLLYHLLEHEKEVSASGELFVLERNMPENKNLKLS